MKQKTYTEEEIFKKIDKWVDEIDWTQFTNSIEKLKQKFMTPQGFRKAIEKSGLKGEKFK